MTYQDDPNINRRNRYAAANQGSGTMWIAGIAAVVVMLGIIIYSMSDNTNVATTERPAANAPASTTGSGGTPGRVEPPAPPRAQ